MSRTCPSECPNITGKEKAPILQIGLAIGNQCAINLARAVVGVLYHNSNTGNLIGRWPERTNPESPPPRTKSPADVVASAGRTRQYASAYEVSARSERHPIESRPVPPPDARLCRRKKLRRANGTSGSPSRVMEYRVVAAGGATGGMTLI
jgi:hypothetical protein